MNKVFELSPAPSYYLISPDKKIVYKSVGKTPSDNSEFLRLVKEYRAN